jgi:dihydroorotate dehydrogenase electron transfer subunit
MRDYDVYVSEIGIDIRGLISARINCPATAVPKAGQYCLAWSPADSSSSLPMAIFLAQRVEQGFLTAPGMPAAWQPGTLLRLRGPFGNGFHLPHGIQRMALAAFGDSPARLLPLIPQALEQSIAVTLFSQVSPTNLPTAVEISHLDELPEAMQWADFLAIDMPGRQFNQLSRILKIDDPRQCSIPAQILIDAPMPCGGMANCGVCALPNQRQLKLACHDGPVFDLRTLEW